METNIRKMKLYKLTVTCPYYGDTYLVGIYSSMVNVETAKKIICRNVKIENYEDRFDVSTTVLDEFPYDHEAHYVILNK